MRQQVVELLRVLVQQVKFKTMVGESRARELLNQLEPLEPALPESEEDRAVRQIVVKSCVGCPLYDDEECTCQHPDLLNWVGAGAGPVHGDCPLRRETLVVMVTEEAREES